VQTQGLQRCSTPFMEASHVPCEAIFPCEQSSDDVDKSTHITQRHQL
jgi:hypothetical protein